MGSYVFRWPREATEVYVTGTFDDWGKTVQLEKKGTGFEKEVHLPAIDGKIQYKFVVDGAWVTDSDARQESDGHNNINNVLLPEDLKSPAQPSSSEFESLTGGNTAAAVMAGVVPESTTAQLAGDVPKETTSSSVPGGFPETPASEVKEVSVNPLPATNGIGNPVKLAPGEPVPPPSTLHDNTIESTVRTDKAGYEADASNPVFTSKEQAQPDSLAVPPVTGAGIIPESSLPMNPPQTSEPGVTIQSAHPTSTTAALAAQVPLESERNAQAADEVPEVVKESLAEAHQSPEAAANPEAVEEKAQVENELQHKLDAAGASTAAPAADVPEVVKESLEQAHQGPEAAANAEAVEEKAAVEHELQNKVPVSGADSAAPASDVPAVVRKSLELAHQDPEAAANAIAVEEKKEVEQELLHKVSPAMQSGEPAPTASAATATTAPGAGNVDSTDVSPGTTSRPTTANAAKPETTTQTQPTVTTGVASGTTTTESKPAAAKPTGDASHDSSKDKKKKNRASGFFQKLKEKLR